MKLALNILVKNDLDNLKKVFPNYLNVFDKIYIYDNGSDEMTVDYLKYLKNSSAGHKLKIYSKPEPLTSFAKARNFLLQKTNEDFMMWLDSDDEVSMHELLLLKTYLQENPETPALYLPYFYAYEGETPLIYQKRERVVNLKHKWKWVSPIHEYLTCVSDDVEIQQSEILTVKHNRGKFKSKNTPPAERNYSILKNLRTHSPLTVYYLIRDSSSILNALSVESLFTDKLAKIVDSHDFFKTQVLTLLASNFIRESRYEYAKPYIEKLMEVLPELTNFSKKVCTDYYCGVSQWDTALKIVESFDDVPDTNSTMSVDFGLYNGYKELLKSKIYFQTGNIKKALENLFISQSKYYPTEEFSTTYNQLKSYCKARNINLMWSEIPEGPSPIYFDTSLLQINISKSVLNRCDFTEFCTSHCHIDALSPKSLEGVLHNSSIEIKYTVGQNYEQLHPWQKEKSTNIPNFAISRLDYSNKVFLNTTNEIVRVHADESAFNGCFKKDKDDSYFMFPELFGACSLVTERTTKVPPETCKPKVKQVKFRKDKKIVFIASGMTNWNGETPDKVGIGASESSLILLAEELATKGYSVHVYCPTEHPIIYHGVYYIPISEFSETNINENDVLISSRMAHYIQKRICNTQVLWLHDDPETTLQLFTDLQNIDRIVCVSESQMMKLLTLYPFISDDIVTYAYNIVPEVEPIDIGRVEGRAVILSSPDRTSLNWITMRPEIIKETYVFYGWQNYELSPNKMLSGLREKYRLRQAGFKVIGRISRPNLYEFLPTCEFMPYLSEFFETFCVAAVEAIRHGVKVVTNNESALLEVCSLSQKDFKLFNYVPSSVESLKKCPDILRHLFENAKSPSLPAQSLGDSYTTWKGILDL